MAKHHTTDVVPVGVIATTFIPTQMALMSFDTTPEWDYRADDLEISFAAGHVMAKVAAGNRAAYIAQERHIRKYIPRIPIYEQVRKELITAGTNDPHVVRVWPKSEW
jgi:hypothetical protein